MRDFYKKIIFFLIAVLFLSTGGQLSAALIEMYVDVSNSTPAAPYNNTGNASTSIQTAVDYINTANGGVDLTAGGNNVIIYVLGGIYDNEQVTIDGYTTGLNNDIVIQNYNNEVPIITDGTSTENVFLILDDWVSLIGFTVRGVELQGAVDNGAISINNATNVTIRNCKIYNTTDGSTTSTYGGIHIAGGTINCKIVKCTIYSNAMNGIRMTGNNHLIISNIVYGNGPAAYYGIRAGTDGAGTIIAYNRSYGHLGTGIYINRCDDFIVYNNLCYSNGVFGLELFANADDAINNKIINNTFVGNGSHGISGDVSGASVTGNIFRNNIIAYNGGWGVNEDDGAIGWDVDYNLFYNNALGVENIDDAWGANNIDGQDPLFVSMDPLHSDFLKIGVLSPCIDRGEDRSADGVIDDFWLNPRPWDFHDDPTDPSKYDIGAHERYFTPFAATLIMYVDSVNGSDTNMPYESATHAGSNIQTVIDYIDVAMQSNNDLVSANRSAIIYVLNGNYTDPDDNIKITQYITGAGNNITLRNYPGDTPVIKDTVIVVSNSYTVIQGLEVDGGAVPITQDTETGPKGIQIWASSCIIRSNIVHDITNTVETWTIAIDINGGDLSTGNIIEYNDCYNNKISIRMKAADNITRYNTVHHAPNGNRGGIRCGNVGGGNIIHHNIVYSNINFGIRNTQSDSNEIINNLIFGNSLGGILIEDGGAEQAGTKVINNTVYDNTGIGISVYGNGSGVTFFTFINNLVVSNSGDGVYGEGTITYDGAIGSADYNNSVGNGGADDNIAGWGGNNISSDPLFISTEPSSAGFLRLKGGSPCIDQGYGASGYGVNDDYWLDLRPYDDIGVVDLQSAYDIGADEFMGLGTIMTMYVDINNGSDANTPYSDPLIAAQNIQTVIDYIATVNGSDDLIATDRAAVIFILNGDYNERVTVGVNATDIYTTSPSNNITILNYPGHSPVISGVQMGFDIRTSYTRLSGMEVTDANDALNDGGGINVQTGSNIMITNCYVHDYSDLLGGGDPGIFLKGNKNTVINCFVSNEQRGISISGNYLSVIGCTVAGTLNSAIVIVGDNLTISHNLTYGSGVGGRGILLNGDTTDCEVFNNVIYDMNGSAGIRVEANPLRARIYNNTIYSNAGDGIHFVGTGNFQNVSVFNNLITDNGNWGMNADEGGTYNYDIIDYNNVYNNGSGVNNTTAWGANNFSADPGFESIIFGDPDFMKLSSSSTCIDAGTTSGTMPIDDYWNEPRPYDDPSQPDSPTQYDIGADEYYVAGILDYFVVTHDSNAFVNTWEQIIITAKDSTGVTVSSNTGTITIDVASSGGTITWSNGNNCGTYDDTTVAGKVLYTFDNSGCENGVVTLYIQDNTSESINIDVSMAGTNIIDDDTEGFLQVIWPVRMIVTKTIIFPAVQPTAGDLVTYRIDWTNAGTGTGTDVKIVDTIPFNTVYSAGTMSNESGALTDASGDDAGAIVGDTITFCPGTGVSAPSDGGLVTSGASGTYFFSVEINESVFSNGSLNITTASDTRVHSICQDDIWDGDDDQDAPLVGDQKAGDGGNRESKAVFSFGLTNIPADASVTTATLSFRVNNVNFKSTVNDIDWPIRMDHIIYSNIYGGGDSQGRFELTGGSRGVIHPAVYSMDNTTTGNTWYNVTVSTLVQYCLDFPKSFPESPVGTGGNKIFQVMFYDNATGNYSANGEDNNISIYDQSNVDQPYLTVYFQVAIDAPMVITNNITTSGSNFNNVNTNLITPLQAPVPANINLTKTVVSPVGIPSPEDYIRYRIDYTNTGTLTADNIFITDALPAGTFYSQGSIWINGSQMSDTAGDDAASYTNSLFTFCPDTGTAPITPGDVAGGASGTIFFTLQVGTNRAPDQYNVTLVNDPTYDREVETNNNNDGSWNQNALTGLIIRAGDTSVTPTELWGFVLGVDISSIPSSANITSATQYIYMTDAGQEPWDVDPFKVDYISLAQSFISTLGHEEVYTLNGIELSFYTFNWPGDAPYTDWYGVPCPNQVQHALTNSTSSASGFFQTRFKSQPGDLNGDNDMLIANSADNAANKPYLKVYYEDGAETAPTSVTNIVNVTGANITNRTVTNIQTISNLVVINESTLSIIKSISNVTLGGNPILGIAPGSTITYSIWYSNQGPTAADNVLIYDPLDGNVKYFDMDVIGGWTNQFTADPAPSQVYNSAAYSNASTGVDPAIQFVRWKLPSLAASATGKLTYKVIVK